MADELKLDEINFSGTDLATDPKPATQKNKPTRSVGRPSKASKTSEVATELEGFLKLINLGLMSRDLHQIYDENDELAGYETCLAVYITVNNRGLPVLTEDGKRFCNAAAAIIVDNDFLLKMLESGDKAGKWLQLFLALQPLVMNIINNHGRGRVRSEAE